MTSSDSFSSAGETNPPASGAEPTSVNSRDDVSTGGDGRVNLNHEDVNLVSDEQPQRVFDTALEMQHAGINVVPVKEDGTKAPDLPRWTKYQKQSTTGDQIWSWFGSDQKTGIGCIYGEISGNTEMLEFEGRAVEEGVLAEISELMENSGLASAWEAITTGWVDRSPSGGLHFRFRVEGTPVKGNTKLARRVAEFEELTDEERELKLRKPTKIFYRTLIETRGEGGFGVCAPSRGKVHPSGKPYTRVTGGPSTIPVIDAETYEAIHDICTVADAVPKEEAPQWRGRPPADLPEGQLRPGDDYNARGDVGELLKQHGWSFVYQRGPASYWCRPGKNKGISASYNWRESNRLYVFTSSTEFDSERAYSPFTAYAILEHGGNYKNAASDLAGRGFGTRMTSAPIPGQRDTGAYDAWATEKVDTHGHVLTPGQVAEGMTPPPAPPAQTTRRPDPVENEHVEAVGAPGTYSSPEAPMRVARELEPTWIQGSSRTLHHWRDTWMRWTGTHWSEVGNSALRSKLYLKLEHAIFYAPNKKGELEPKPWNPSIKKISALVDAIAAVTHLDEKIEPNEWLGPHKGGPRLISCANLMINPITKETQEHTPAYFTTSAVPYDYNPDAECPEWMAFLEKVFPGDVQSQELLQEWAGYVVSGWTHYQKGLQLIGPPRAGKGTVARILEKLIGKENAVGTTLKTLVTNFGLQDLIGKSLCTVGDAHMENRNSSEVVGRLLSITGEDSLPVDRKNKAPWNGKLPVRMMILANKAPRFNDSSGAITGRFLTLNFSQSFAGREDRTLEGKLTQELSGILNWALEGLVRLEERGYFVQPESASDIIENQREEGAPHQAFVEQKCVTGPEQWIKKDDLFHLWVVWCELNRLKFTGTSASFATEMYAAVPGISKTRKRVNGKLEHVFVGVTAQVEPGMKLPYVQSDPR
jgi:putative DNA primase/helicase